MKKIRCFQYAVAVAFNHEEIKKDLKRIIKIKPSINKYNWEGINFPPEEDDWQEFEKFNVTIALHVQYSKKEKMYPAFASKHNSNYEKQVVLLITPN